MSSSFLEVVFKEITSSWRSSRPERRFPRRVWRLVISWQVGSDFFRDFREDETSPNSDVRLEMLRGSWLEFLLGGVEGVGESSASLRAAGLR